MESLGGWSLHKALVELDSGDEVRTKRWTDDWKLTGTDEIESVMCISVHLDRWQHHCPSS